MEVTGRLTKDAEVRKTKNGKEFVSFSIAVNDSYKAKGGELMEFTEYFEVSYWLSTAIADKLLKGTIVILTGRVYLNEYKTKDGAQHASLAVHANNIKVLTWAKRKDNTNTAAKSEQTSGASTTNDDIPF